MSIDKSRIDDFEQRYRKILFERVRAISDQQSELISNTQKIASVRAIDLTDEIPNIGITLNNKIVELQFALQRLGVSMYSQVMEGYGTGKIDFLLSSPIGEAIIFDLMGKATEGTNKLIDFNKKLLGTEQEESGQEKSLDVYRPGRRLWMWIKSLLGTEQEESGQEKSLDVYRPGRGLWMWIKNLFRTRALGEVSSLKQEEEAAEHFLAHYTEANKQIREYNLRENVLESIVRIIREKGISAYNLPDLLKESFIPDLQKLGLEDLIPQLQQALIEEYKKDLPNPEVQIIEADKMYLYVPDFKRTSEDQGQDKINMLHILVEQQMDGVRAIEEGVGVGAFALVDKTIPREDRQAAVQAIQEGLQPERQEGKEGKLDDKLMTLDKKEEVSI